MAFMLPTELLSALDRLVRPELNMLYTVPPFDRGKPDSFDGGWYCREHAYHCAVVSNMCGCRAAIFTGHYVLNFKRTGGTMEISSLDTSAGHAWCSVGNLKPVDLSMTLHLWPGETPPLQGVFGSQQQGQFNVVYSSAESDLRAARTAKAEENWIGFWEEQVIRHNLKDLVTNPFLFLHQAGEQGWDKVHGADIFQRVNLHLYKVARGLVKPLWQDWDESDRLAMQHFAITQIRLRHPGATKKVLRLLGA
jgi:hypothetical protein